MRLPTFNIVVKISVITAGIIIIFQVTNMLFIYKYLKFDYYLLTVALFFLAAGIVISKYHIITKPKPGADPALELTIKERNILQLIVEGKSNKEIAALNFVEISTIKTHINNIYFKLGLSTRKEAVLKYKSHFPAAGQSKIHPFSTS